MMHRLGYAIRQIGRQKTFANRSGPTFALGGPRGRNAREGVDATPLKFPIYSYGL